MKMEMTVDKQTRELVEPISAMEVSNSDAKEIPDTVASHKAVQDVDAKETVKSSVNSLDIKEKEASHAEVMGSDHQSAKMSKDLMQSMEETKAEPRLEQQSIDIGFKDEKEIMEGKEIAARGLGQVDNNASKAEGMRIDQQVEAKIFTPADKLSAAELALLREDWEGLKSTVESLEFVEHYKVLTIAYRRWVYQKSRSYTVSTP